MSYGEIRGVQTFENPTSFSARDEFDQSAGALTGKTAPVGGVWVGAGDADDFSVETTGKTAQRTALLDGSIYDGRFAISGVAASAAQTAQVDCKLATASTADFNLGVVARYVDANNWLAGVMRWFGGGGGSAAGTFIGVWKRVAGTWTSIGSKQVAHAALSTFYTLRLEVLASGRWTLWHFPVGALGGVPILTGSDPALATGGALASGKPAFFDSTLFGSACTRTYDNFQAFVPTADAAIFANQSAEIRHDRVIREDSAGAVWTPVSQVKGSYLRLPPAGLEGRSCRIIIKASRNDPDTGTDPGIDDISARAYYRPSWLTIPGS